MFRIRLKFADTLQKKKFEYKTEFASSLFFCCCWKCHLTTTARQQQQQQPQQHKKLAIFLQKNVEMSFVAFEVPRPCYKVKKIVELLLHFFNIFTKLKRSKSCSALSKLHSFFCQRSHQFANPALSLNGRQIFNITRSLKKTTLFY